MTNEELRTKIVEILEETEYEWTEEKNGYILQIFYDKLADALIAAGIGDVSELKKHRVVVEKSLIPEDDNAYILPNIPPTVKQLYSGEEVEQIVKERRELKDELRSKVEYIHEQDEVIKEYKHRAKVAERALENACVVILSSRNGDQPRRLRAYYKAYLEAAEKELAEEGKDG